MLELIGVFPNSFARVLSNHKHGSYMTFGHGVLFEGIIVRHLALAHLAIPPEALQALSFHLIGEPFC